MLKTLAMILPVLIPSWRFFKTIEPSPRVQWSFVRGDGTEPRSWEEFHPRPTTITPRQMLTRLFWNPQRNEELFVISCAERIQQQPTAHSIDEITRRIQHEVGQRFTDSKDRHLQFRLVFVHREQACLVEEVVFLSDPQPATAPAI